MNKNVVNIRVRYKETDRMGVVYYSNYLVWFEIGRTELFRDSGMDYRELERTKNIFFPVIRAECDYKVPVKYDDLIRVETEIADIGKTRVTFRYLIKTDDILNASGQTCHVFVDANGKPMPIPPDVFSALSGFNALN